MKSKEFIKVHRFNPYIHGTTSSALHLMSKTNFQLMPTLKMLDDFKTAPQVGELTQGGYNFLGFKLVQNENIGATSFGRLNAGTYNLEQIISTYTHFSLPTKKDTLKHFRHELKRLIPCGFSNFNLFLIYFTRARQMHYHVDELISSAELEILNQQLQAIVQFYYFVQLLGTYIHPDFTAIKMLLLHLHL